MHFYLVSKDLIVANLVTVYSVKIYNNCLFVCLFVEFFGVRLTFFQTNKK